MAHKKVKKQKDHVEQRADHYRGERSPYWDSVRDKEYGESGGVQEDVRANPDVLTETEIATPSTPPLLMGEAVAHLQGRQKEVYLLTMREGKSLTEVAEILGIAKGSAQVFRDRAIRFLTKYCEEAIRKGRV